MHSKTSSLKSELQELYTLKDKLELLKNAYEGEDCYVITAGPSLSTINAKSLKKITEGKLVLAVKQAIYHINGKADFHLLNPWNYIEYEYSEKDTIVVLSKENRTIDKPDNRESPPTPNCKPDIEFNFINKSYDRKKILSNTKEYDRFLLDNNHDRPWGPGIMYEVAFYLAIHLGVKKVTTIGWDIGSKSSNSLIHFYDSNYVKLKKRLLSLINRRKSLKKNLIFEGEIELVSEASLDWYYFLKKHNIELKCYTDSKLVSKKIPRVSFTNRNSK